MLPSPWLTAPAGRLSHVLALWVKAACGDSPRWRKRQRPGKARPPNAPIFVPGLLELDGGASLFELRLNRIGFVLIHAFLDGARGGIDEVLGLLEAQAGHGADDLDDLDLLTAGLGEDDVERRLLLDGRTAVGAARSGGRDGDRSGGRD